MKKCLLIVIIFMLTACADFGFNRTYKQDDFIHISSLGQTESYVVKNSITTNNNHYREVLILLNEKLPQQLDNTNNIYFSSSLQTWQLDCVNGRYLQRETKYYAQSFAKGKPLLESVSSQWHNVPNNGSLADILENFICNIDLSTVQ